MQILAGVNSSAPTFTYHVFTSSGTLTVTSGGTLSLCTVGGGGGGGYNIGGAGGGGELDLFSNFTVSGNLTVTIGAGGAFSNTGAAKGGTGGLSTVVEGVTTHQSALGGGGGGSQLSISGADGGSGGGGNYGGGVGGTASGSNTNAGGAGNNTLNYGGGGGGATSAGTATALGGQGYALATIDANLTSANFPTTLTSKTHVSSGGGGASYVTSGGPVAGGTNAGNGQYNPGTTVPATNPTSYGCGGGGGGAFDANTATSGFAGVVFVKYLTGTVVASGGQETVSILV